MNGSPPALQNLIQECTKCDQLYSKIQKWTWEANSKRFYRSSALYLFRATVLSYWYFDNYHVIRIKFEPIMDSELSAIVQDACNIRADVGSMTCKFYARNSQDNASLGASKQFLALFTLWTKTKNGIILIHLERKTLRNTLETLFKISCRFFLLVILRHNLRL